MNSRTKAYRLHARRRARERYNISLDKKKKNKIIQAIKSGQSKRQKKLTNSRTLHEVCVDETMFYIVYSKTTKEIVTCLERHHAEKRFNV